MSPPWDVVLNLALCIGVVSKSQVGMSQCTDAAIQESEKQTLIAVPKYSKQIQLARQAALEIYDHGFLGNSGSAINNKVCRPPGMSIAVGSEPGSHGSRKKNGKEEKPGSTSALGRLQSMARVSTRIRVTPLTPPSEFDEFQIVETDSERDAVVLRKGSSSQQVYVPISRISGVRHPGPGRPEVLQLNGLTVVDAGRSLGLLS
jgi:hypothetical protein